MRSGEVFLREGPLRKIVFERPALTATGGPDTNLHARSRDRGAQGNSREIQSNFISQVAKIHRISTRAVGTGLRFGREKVNRKTAI
jgi:hypothetical protein